MNRPGTTLLLILLLQCVITAALYWPQQDEPAAAGEQPLLAVPLTDVDSIEITDDSGNRAHLQRSGDHWLLPELDGLPADRERAAQLLAVLGATDHGWPVADSPPARQRFQVADYLHQRQIELLANGETLATLYLGTAPAFRKVYARNAAQAQIYTIALNNHDVPGTDDAWLDRRLLQIRTPMSIAADGYSLHRNGNEWQLGSGGTPDPRELDALLSALRTLQVDGIASEDSQRELADTEAELVLAIDSLAGHVTLELFQLDDQYFVLSSEFPHFFRLGAYHFDRLTGIDAFLLAGPPPQP